MRFDLAHSPFSRRGSFLQLERGFDDDNPRLMLGSARRRIWRNVNGGWGTFFFTVHTLGEADYDAVGHPAECVATTNDGGGWRAAMADADTIVFRTAGDGLRLEGARPMAWADHRGSVIVVADASGDCTHHFKLIGPGKLTLRPRENPEPRSKPGAADYFFDVVAEPAEGLDTVDLACRTLPHEGRFDEKVPCFDAARRSAQADYDAWQARRPQVDPIHSDAADFAWFMLWNQEVGPTPTLGDRRAIYMARQSMNSVWAWDACFDALGVGDADPALAWDQVLLHFDHQSADGRLPDSINDGGPNLCYVKPPIQGWTILRLINALGIDACRDVLQDVYEPLLAWTMWWHDHRCDRDDGLCHYQHGNDSGWDNATVFAEPGPVVSPDLQAFLAVQWRALARTARLLGKDGDVHDARATRQIDAMRRGLSTDGRLGFIAPDGKLRQSTSSLTRMPVLLGEDVPESLRPCLVEDLSPGSPHVTDFGVATEATDSPHYASDGYWRGPIWAPETYLAIDGLRGMGQVDAAAELARRFCRLCALPGSAMHENFDAVTGRGLRRAAYSWTAAAFIRLAEWLHTEDRCS
jgi:glycogen debranching enzyme